MSKDLIEDVSDFHLYMDQPVLSVPQVPPKERLNMRWALVREEILELYNALGVGTANPTDLPKTADAIADSIYVLIGMALEFGIPLQEVWDRVQASNMAKLPGNQREDGKILKPPGWVPPDVAGALVDAGWKP